MRLPAYRLELESALIIQDFPVLFCPVLLQNAGCQVILGRLLPIDDVSLMGDEHVPIAFIAQESINVVCDVNIPFIGYVESINEIWVAKRVAEDAVGCISEES